MKIDNFALTMWQKCPAMHDLRINHHWTSRKKSGALGAGGALHLGLAEWYRHNDLPSALLAIDSGWPSGLPIDDWRTKEKVLTVMIEYSKHYPTEGFEVVGGPDPANKVIEIAFTVGTEMYLPCADCGLITEQTVGDERFNPRCENCGGAREEIEYGGIYDMLIEFSGPLYIVDHKTTSIMGPTWPLQFKPNNQMTGYIWGANRLQGYSFSSTERMPVSGALINGIGWYQKGATRFERPITTRSKDEIREWLGNVYTECCAIQRHQLLGEWPMRTESCITKFGACEFHTVHTLATESERQKFLETNYIKDQWDYELREG